MKSHCVTFYSPGTFVAEHTTKPIDSWDIEVAKAMAGEIVERYGAVPYAFKFSTRARTEAYLDSKVTEESGLYFINCRVRTLEEVEADNDPQEAILRSNMRINGFKRIAQTTKGWKSCLPINKGDTVL